MPGNILSRRFVLRIVESNHDPRLMLVDAEMDQGGRLIFGQVEDARLHNDMRVFSVDKRPSRARHTEVHGLPAVVDEVMRILRDHLNL